MDTGLAKAEEPTTGDGLRWADALRTRIEEGGLPPRDAPTRPHVHAKSAPQPPRRIQGGFVEVAASLDRFSRDWGMMVRQLEQQRLHLETTEKERSRLYESLDSLLAHVRNTCGALQNALDSAKAGHAPDDLASKFEEHLRALDELENTAVDLTANMLWMRATWEHYARSMESGEKLRERTM